MGRYFDASSPDSFGEVLDIVIDQAIHRTTAQIDLLDATTGTNLPYELIERHSGQPVLQAVHTLNEAGVPDTLMLNPVPEYDLTVHSIPPVTVSGLTLEPRTHNHLAVSVPTGFIDLSPSRDRSALRGVPVTVNRDGDESCETVFIQEVGARQRYLAGTYSLEFGTTPPVRVEGVRVGDKRIVRLFEPVLNSTGTGGYGGLPAHRKRAQARRSFLRGGPFRPTGPPARSIRGDVPCKTRDPNRPLPHPLCGYSSRRKPHPRILIMLDFLTAPQSELDALDRKDTRSGFGQGLLEVGQAQENVVALCADLTGSLKMNAFRDAFPTGSSKRASPRPT